MKRRGWLVAKPGLAPQTIFCIFFRRKEEEDSLEHFWLVACSYYSILRAQVREG